MTHNCRWSYKNKNKIYIIGKMQFYYKNNQIVVKYMINSSYNDNFL